MARPRSRTQTQDEQMFKKFEKYINDTTLPIIAEFAYMNEIDRNYLYDNAIFSTLLKRCIAKKEANLEKGALTGKLNPSMAIFSLKQIVLSINLNLGMIWVQPRRKTRKKTFCRRF